MIIFKTALICSVFLIVCSCGTGYLDVKPAIRQRVPATLADFGGLLDNTNDMGISSHALGMIGGDEFYVSPDLLATFPSGVNHNYQKRAYVWERQIFEGNEAVLLDWNTAYRRILTANLVLDGIDRLSMSSSDEIYAQQVRGAALFHRAWNYYCLAQLFCPAFDENEADGQLGLPLRLEPDLTVKIPRSSLKQTYQRIISDLESAEQLLPEIEGNKYRPSKAAVYALLARAFLQMDRYSEALIYANRALALKSDLLDFNLLDLSTETTFSARGEDNPEIIFLATCPGNTTYLLLLTHHFMNYSVSGDGGYEKGDLRYPAFFWARQDGVLQYKGSYDGTSLFSYFTGLATDEIYLIRAECNARMGNVGEALLDLNYLRKFRFDPAAYLELTSDNELEVLTSVLAERRKELFLRGTRWEDLKRLNKEPTFAKTLTRETLDGTITLMPGSNRYVWPLPEEAVRFGGYEQPDR